MIHWCHPRLYAFSTSQHAPDETIDSLGHQSVPGEQQSPSSAWLGHGRTVNRINIFILQKVLTHSEAVGWAFQRKPPERNPVPLHQHGLQEDVGISFLTAGRVILSSMWGSAWPTVVMSSQPMTDSPSEARGCCKQQSIFHRLCGPGGTALPEHHLWWGQWKLIHNNHCFLTEHAVRLTQESGYDDSVFPWVSWAVY